MEDGTSLLREMHQNLAVPRSCLDLLEHAISDEPSAMIREGGVIAAGFSAERILHEYEVALNTVILAEQDELTEPIRAVIASVLGLDTTSLQIVNRPPTRSKPIYMKVWEARKADGLDYDPEDERQQAFLSEITKYNIRSIE